jgi:hypothetical protein
MPDSSYYRDQAAIFDRVADACSMPELVPYYRQLAEDYRKRAADAAVSSPGRGSFPKGKAAE